MRQSHPENQGLPVKNAEIRTANAGFGRFRLSATSDDAWQASGYVCLMDIKVDGRERSRAQKRPRSLLKMWRGWSCALPCICMQELPPRIVITDICIQAGLAPRYGANTQSGIRVRQRRKAVTASSSQTSCNKLTNIQTTAQRRAARHQPFTLLPSSQSIRPDHPLSTKHTTAKMADRFPSLEEFDSGGKFIAAFHQPCPG
jgi:hypothetical protein